MLMLINLIFFYSISLDELIERFLNLRINDVILFLDTFRIEENDRMDRREQAKQQQKQARLSQSQSERDNEVPKPPLFGVPKKVRTYN